MKRSSSTNRFQPITSIKSGELIEILPDIAYFTDQIVNVVFLGDPSSESPWLLIDAGMPRSGKKVIAQAEQRFGKNRPPEAIILTHGHFDHVGGLIDILEEWPVPVYAHPFEFPYLTGEKRYPNPDITVEGGMVAKLSFMFPVDPIDISEYIRPLSEDHTIPFYSGWRWVHTPGHSEGHVSLFRHEDKFLIAGDAFVTVRQDQLYKVLTQKKELTGPPRYLTTDWESAEQSIRTLHELQPAFAVTGHGQAVKGDWLTKHLTDLKINFQKIAVPDYGNYIDESEKETD